jgi:predicted DNA-binding antitoxin AbrB/MazE fold protein
MVIRGRVENGMIVPEEPFSLPEGTEVTIIVRAIGGPDPDAMLPDERARYLAALAAIDGFANENPGDTFRGADHDNAIYQ